MDSENIAAIARGLTPEQAAWILTAPKGEQPVTGGEYESAPPFYVQFSPDEYCPETGCYLGGGERFWFASGTIHGAAGETNWLYRYGLTETGLAVRQHLLAAAGDA